MNKSKSLKILAIVFFISGVWDTFGGISHAFFIGAGRSVNNPPTHPFYAIFLAQFFFCFAYLQFVTALNIRRYLFNVGVVTIGRIFYVILLFAYIFGSEGFPNTLMFTGIVDLAWSIIYVLLATLSDEVRIKDLFLPYREKK